MMYFLLPAMQVHWPCRICPNFFPHRRREGWFAIPPTKCHFLQPLPAFRPQELLPTDIITTKSGKNLPVSGDLLSGLADQYLQMYTDRIVLMVQRWKVIEVIFLRFLLWSMEQSIIRQILTWINEEPLSKPSHPSISLLPSSRRNANVYCRWVNVNIFRFEASQGNGSRQLIFVLVHLSILVN